MNVMNTFLPFAASAISFIFAVNVFRRYFYKKNPYVLLWGIGLVFYGIGGFCEGYFGAFGWNALTYRLWYLFGAILVAAWLGQGTVYLLAKRKWADALMAILLIGSLYGAYRVFTAQLDPSLLTTSVHTGSELSGHAIVTPGVRTLTPIFNLYGTITLVGGALYSSWIFWRKRVLLHRTIGNILIATGAMLPAFGGAFSRFGIPSALYLGEFFGVILMFIGFLRATTPMGEALRVPVSQAAD
jgi:vacuolar-type H+-ATPase subunit I/STV1